MDRVIIVGAGVIVAACAQALTAAGRPVLLVDAAGPGAGASGRSFGWINASFHLDEDHFALRQAGIAAWHRLAGAVPDLPLDRSGALWWEGQGSDLAEMHRSLSALGYPVEKIDRTALLSRVGCLRAPPEEALSFPSEMAIDPAEAATVLIAAAARTGLLRCAFGVRVKGLAMSGGAVCGI